MKITKPKAIIAIIVLLAGAYTVYAIKHRTPFELEPPAVNDTAPEISLADTSGKMVRLSDLKGRVVLVNFWASWCPPCKAELEDFEKIYGEYENRGIEIIGIAIDEIQPSLIKDLGISFPVVGTNERVTRAYGSITNVPVSFLIGKDGRIIRKLKKVYAEKDLRHDIEKALSAQEKK